MTKRKKSLNVHLTEMEDKINKRLNPKYKRRAKYGWSLGWSAESSVKELERGVK